jgi:threonine dehydrogenase-like Zn-dependent dehydrogenase
LKANCLKLPGEPGDLWEDDFVLRISLDEAPTAFAKFDAREEGYIKVVLKLA